MKTLGRYLVVYFALFVGFVGWLLLLLEVILASFSSDGAVLIRFNAFNEMIIEIFVFSIFTILFIFGIIYEVYKDFKSNNRTTTKNNQK